MARNRSPPQSADSTFHGTPKPVPTNRLQLSSRPSRGWLQCSVTRCLEARRESFSLRTVCSRRHTFPVGKTGHPGVPVHPLGHPLFPGDLNPRNFSIPLAHNGFNREKTRQNSQNLHARFVRRLDRGSLILGPLAALSNHRFQKVRPPRKGAKFQASDFPKGSSIQVVRGREKKNFNQILAWKPYFLHGVENLSPCSSDPESPAFREANRSAKSLPSAPAAAAPKRHFPSHLSQPAEPRQQPRRRFESATTRGQLSTARWCATGESLPASVGPLPPRPGHSPAD